MLPVDAQTAIQQIIIAISSGDYPAALSRTTASRCSVADISQTVIEYGRAFSAPPFADWDVLAVRPEVGRDIWSVRAPLWSESEGGRSDLELRLTVSIVGGAASVELEDLRVA